MPKMGASLVPFRALYGLHELLALRTEEPGIVRVVYFESVEKMVYGIRGVNVNETHRLLVRHGWDSTAVDGPPVKPRRASSDTALAALYAKSSGSVGILRLALASARGCAQDDSRVWSSPWNRGSA